MPCQATLEAVMSQVTDLSKGLLKAVLHEKKETYQHRLYKMQYSVIVKLLKQEGKLITELAELKNEVDERMEQLDDGRGKDENQNQLNEGQLLDCYEFLKVSYQTNEALVHFASLIATAKVCNNPPHVIHNFAPYKEHVLKKIEKKAEQLREEKLKERFLLFLNIEEDYEVNFHTGMKITVDAAED